jgi:hypothetical protein
MRLIARLRRFLRWLWSRWHGSNQIAVSMEGREVIGEEEMAALPEDEREKWEPVDESGVAYWRKPW